MRRNYGLEQNKISFQGEILSIQPRTTVWRYVLDNRTHGHIGYNIFMSGTAEGEEKELFAVAISEKQYEKSVFNIGDVIKGTAWTKKYPEWEYADYYRAGALKIVKKNEHPGITAEAPWTGAIPPMETYEWRGARMLDTKCWKGKCFTCKFATMANVTIEYDWGSTQKFRFESFCYGPKNCKFYKMGKPRAVPSKHSGTCYDEGWLDEICTERRNDEE